MNPCASKPWLAHYPADVPPELPLPSATVLDAFEGHAATRPDAPALFYFEEPISFGRLDQLAGGFAALLAGWGVGKGDRVALWLQNDPQFAVALFGAWKRGAIVVPLNPMFKSEELVYALRDSGARILVCLESLFAASGDAVQGTAVEHVVTTHERDLLGRGPTPSPLAMSPPKATPPGAVDLLPAIERLSSGAHIRDPLTPDDPAWLVYTSGTTGHPKGATGLHRNIAFNAEVYRVWMRLGSGDSILGMAPLFHITGLVGHLAIGALAGIPLILSHRFDAEEMLRLAERLRPTMTVAAITAFLALMNTPSAVRRGLSSITRGFSGGAPVPPGVVERFDRAFGVRIHNIYGLTESHSPTHAVPLEADAPVDPQSGALSIGFPLPNLEVRILDLDDPDKDAPPAEAGELAIKGPAVFAGYWGRPEETAKAFRNGFFLTGDVVVMDERGWFYVVDRRKDMIVASGFKVWPGEVEGVLCRHPAVREAAVVGVPDDYRGEAVKAFVSLREPESVDPEELRRFCRDRLAAYKVPRDVEILPDIPKTASGKLLRRSLRLPRPAAPRAAKVHEVKAREEEA